MERNDRAKRPRVLSGRAESLLNRRRREQEVLSISSGSDNIPNANGPPVQQVQVPVDDKPAALLQDKVTIRGLPRSLFNLRVREGDHLINTLQDYYLDGLLDALNNHQDPFDKLRQLYGKLILIISAD